MAVLAGKKYGADGGAEYQGHQGPLRATTHECGRSAAVRLAAKAATAALHGQVSRFRWVGALLRYEPDRVRRVRQASRISSASHLSACAHPEVAPPPRQGWPGCVPAQNPLDPQYQNPCASAWGACPTMDSGIFAAAPGALMLPSASPSASYWPPSWI